MWELLLRTLVGRFRTVTGLGWWGSESESLFFETVNRVSDR